MFKIFSAASATSTGRPAFGNRSFMDMETAKAFLEEVGTILDFEIDDESHAMVAFTLHGRGLEIYSVKKIS